MKSKKTTKRGSYWKDIPPQERSIRMSLIRKMGWSHVSKKKRTAWAKAMNAKRWSKKKEQNELSTR